MGGDNDSVNQNENLTNDTKKEVVTESEDTEANSDEMTKDEENKEEVNEIKCSDMMPDPKNIFKNGTIDIVDGSEKLYIFTVTNYTDEEYDAYIEECKNMGFSDVDYEMVGDSIKNFGASTDDGNFYCDISMEIDNGTILVSCKKSAKN